ncbi:hypothetical protein BH11PLA2_BH11PLA2_32080 [soil metagenome]
MKILDQLVMACRTMNFAPATESCYLSWVDQYLRYHRDLNRAWVHPHELHEPAVQLFLSHLAVNRQLSASTQTQAMCALVFFYREVLRQPLGEIHAFRAKRPERIPTVLSVDEVRRVLTELDRQPTLGLLGRLLYGGGLRVSEGCELRVMDLDFDRRQIVIRCGKGFKDRLVPLPEKCTGPLRQHLERVKLQHDRDCAKGPEWGWAPVCDSVRHKMPNDARTWPRQFVFPSAVSRVNPETPRRERWHTATGVITAAVKDSARREGFSTAGWCDEAGHAACLSPFVRHALIGERRGHSHRSGSARACRRQYHHDLHARGEQRKLRRAQPTRPALTANGHLNRGERALAPERARGGRKPHDFTPI